MGRWMRMRVLLLSEGTIGFRLGIRSRLENAKYALYAPAAF